MSKRIPPDGPSRTKATYKVDRDPAPSPDKQQAQEQEDARDCAKTRELNKLGGAAWALQHMDELTKK